MIAMRHRAGGRRSVSVHNARRRMRAWRRLVRGRRTSLATGPWLWGATPAATLLEEGRVHVWLWRLPWGTTVAWGRQSWHLSGRRGSTGGWRTPLARRGRTLHGWALLVWGESLRGPRRTIPTVRASPWRSAGRSALIGGRRALARGRRTAGRRGTTLARGRHLERHAWRPLGAGATASHHTLRRALWTGWTGLPWSIPVIMLLKVSGRGRHLSRGHLSAHGHARRGWAPLSRGRRSNSLRWRSSSELGRSPRMWSSRMRHTAHHHGVAAPGASRSASALHHHARGRWALGPRVVVGVRRAPHTHAALVLLVGRRRCAPCFRLRLKMTERMFGGIGDHQILTV